MRKSGENSNVLRNSRKTRPVARNEAALAAIFLFGRSAIDFRRGFSGWVGGRESAVLFRG